jgi:C2H2-type zinc finger
LNKMIIILGVIVAVIGIGGYVDATSTHIVLTGTHHTIPLAGLGLAILGALLAVGGFLTGKPSAVTANQFKCSTCGAVFSSQNALDQHSNAKHAKKT